MTDLLVFACVLFCGALVGVVGSAWVVGSFVLDPAKFGQFVSGYLLKFSLVHRHRVLSTCDDEGRLVFIPIDRLAQSIETQLPLWSQPAAEPPDRIRFDPPAGSH